MTCEECVAVISTIDPTQVSRGLRAAVLRHFRQCPDCRARLFKATPAEMSADLNEMVDRDLTDPEFCEVLDIRPRKQAAKS